MGRRGRNTAPPPPFIQEASMIFKPRQLSLTGLDSDTLAADKKSCKRFGPCGVGRQALYLNSFYICLLYTSPSPRDRG